MEEGDRNTPSVVNVRFNRWFGWDGAGDSLWAQSMRPLLDTRELAVTDRHVADLLRNDRELNCRYRQAFGAPPALSNDETLLVDAAKALAAYQETLVTGRTPFDDFRDALARGDRGAAARFPADAQRGLRIFVGTGACSLPGLRRRCRCAGNRLAQRRAARHRMLPGGNRGHGLVRNHRRGRRIRDISGTSDISDDGAVTLCGSGSWSHCHGHGYRHGRY